MEYKNSPIGFDSDTVRASVLADMLLQLNSEREILVYLADGKSIILEIGNRPDLPKVYVKLYLRYPGKFCALWITSDADDTTQYLIKLDEIGQIVNIRIGTISISISFCAEYPSGIGLSLSM